MTDSTGITSKKDWTALRVHTLTLPSGAVVRAMIPDLSLLIAADAVPDSLRGIAMEELMGDIVAMRIEAGTDQNKPEVTLDKEKLSKLADLHYWLVAEMLVEPKVTVEELRDPETRPPNPDLEMLTAIATRERDEDAAGRTLGVMPLSKVARFRHFHECGPDCEACQALSRDLSTRSQVQV